MDYKRKRRNITYHSPACKMYLRHDFNHRCAYCGVEEGSVSQIPEIAERFFEKDHFIPQKESFSEVHQYQNLYYACEKCNGKKDAIVLPLDPCKDDIYNGKEPHILNGKNYSVEALTPLGDEFIKILELNSRYHVEVRKKQYELYQANRESDELARNLHKRGFITDEQYKLFASNLEVFVPENPKLICGVSEFASSLIDVYEHIISRGYPCKIVLYENELDLEIIIGGNSYYGQFQQSQNTKQCRIKTTKLNAWKEQNIDCCVFKYLPDIQIVRCYLIDFKKVNWEKDYCIVSNYIEI